MNYVSRTKLLGLPLIHVTAGRLVDGRIENGIAKGWIAIGDKAFGVLFAMGGVSVAIVPVGGLAIGLIPSGFCALGLYSMGIFSFGVIAQGACAFGLYAATGGLAVATQFAVAKKAFAAHAGDALAEDYIARVEGLGRAMLTLLPLSILGSVAHKIWSKRARKRALAQDRPLRTASSTPDPAP